MLAWQLSEVLIACRMSIDRPWLKVAINVLMMDGKSDYETDFEYCRAPLKAVKIKAVPE